MSLELTQLNSEAAVIGAICVDSRCWSVVEQMIRVEHFGQTQARTAFTAAVELVNAGKPIDPIAIANALGEGGANYIGACMTALPTAANVEQYCEMVIEGAKRRKLSELSDELNEGFLDITQSPTEVLDGIREKIDTLNDDNGRKVISSETAAEAFKEYFLRVKENPELALRRTGYSSLDRQLGGGMLRSAVYVVGARPGMGKTTLALNIAENMASAGKTVLFISLEMGRLQIMSKRIAMCSMLGYTDLITARLNDADMELAFNIADRLAKKPFLLADNSAMTVADIARAARAVKDLGAVVVDYLGLIRPKEASLNRPRYEQMSEISLELHAAAKLLNVPFLVLAQLNRENVGRKEKRPQLTDLRDSGAIEQDADAVILLHRKDYYEKTNEDYQAPETEEIELIVAKNRHANTGIVSLAWNGATGKIAEFSTMRYEEPPRLREIKNEEELPF